MNDLLELLAGAMDARQARDDANAAWEDFRARIAAHPDKVALRLAMEGLLHEGPVVTPATAPTTPTKPTLGMVPFPEADTPAVDDAYDRSAYVAQLRRRTPRSIQNVESAGTREWIAHGTLRTKGMQLTTNEAQEIYDTAAEVGLAQTTRKWGIRRATLLRIIAGKAHGGIDRHAGDHWSQFQA